MRVTHAPRLQFGDGTAPGTSGSIRTTPDPNSPVRNAAGPLNNIKQLSVSDRTGCVVTKDGAVWCWGNQVSSTVAVGITLPTGTKATFVTVGGNSVCALLNDATVACGSGTQVGNRCQVFALVCWVAF